MKLVEWWLCLTKPGNVAMQVNRVKVSKIRQQEDDSARI